MKVCVPDIGDYHDVPVIELLVADGDVVEKDAPLLVLESDKAALEVPAPAAGTVRNLKLKLGDKVSHGSEICELEVEPDAASADAQEAAPNDQRTDAAAAAAEQPTAAPEQADAAPAPTAAAPADTPKDRLDVVIPDIGNNHDVPVIEVLVGDGDHIEKDAPLLVLESDKATLEIPAPASGTVQAFKLKLGDKVSQGAAVCTLVGVAAPSAPAAAPTPATPVETPASKLATPAASRAQAAVSDAAPIAPPAPTQSHGQVPYAGPATRKFARELGVDLSQVKGSAARGRIVIEDVQGFVKDRLAPTRDGGSGIPAVPAVDFAQFGEIETQPLARIRKLSAAHLHRAWLNVPHVTQTDEADITELEAFRKTQSEEAGVKLTLLPFVIKAVTAAIKQYPEFASSLAPDGENLILKKYMHIGFAADTPNGLVVPVVRNADQKGLVQLAQETAALAKKARDGKLQADEMKGGCFSISSLGGIGGSFFTPIVNVPEVAILGVSRSQIKPIWDGAQFAPRLLCPLSLSYDHRVIDGANAARFIVLLSKLLGDLRRLAL